MGSSEVEDVDGSDPGSADGPSEEPVAMSDGGSVEEPATEPAG